MEIAKVKAQAGEAWDCFLTIRKVLYRIKEEKKSKEINGSEMRYLISLCEKAGKALEKIIDMEVQHE